jgi:hypothetical protein
MSKVFDDELRREALPALKVARAAQRNQQVEECRLAVGRIRLAYFEAIYGSH